MSQVRCIHKKNKNRTRYFRKDQVEAKWFDQTDWILSDPDFDGEESELTKEITEAEQRAKDLKEKAVKAVEEAKQEPENATSPPDDLHTKPSDEETKSTDYKVDNGYEKMTDDELAEAHAEKFGKKPHHKTKRETIIKKLNS